MIDAQLMSANGNLQTPFLKGLRARRATIPAIISKDMYILAHSSAVKHAEENNEEIIYPEENQLQIDIDSEEAKAIFSDRIQRISRWVKCEYKIQPSKSGEPGHYHIYVDTDRVFSQTERVLVQLLLGSDPIRELLSWARIVTNDPHPTLFLEKKKELAPVPSLVNIESIREVRFND